MRIAYLQRESFEIAESKGWHEKPRSFGDLIALLHSEISEINLAVIEGDFVHIPEEIADVAIRLGDTCGLLDINLRKSIKKFHKKLCHDSTWAVWDSNEPLETLDDVEKPVFAHLYYKGRNLPFSLDSMHLECSLALEGYRNLPEGKEPKDSDEIRFAFARLLIRCVWGLAGKYGGGNLSHAVERKMEINRNRPYRHGGKRL